MRTVIALTAALALALVSACGGGSGEDSGLPTAGLFVIDDEGQGGELTVELARTAEERSRGLMGRREMPGGRGMLFVFEGETQASFWMKDTLIPLSIAFIAADGTILDIQDMEPLSTDLHTPPQPYLYALEVNQGWFAENGLEVGDRAEIPSEAVEVDEADEGE